MNLNLSTHRLSKIAIILLTPLFLGLVSCRSSDPPIQEDSKNAYNVKINMLGFLNEEQAPAKSASANKTAISHQAVQNSTIKIDENNYITASLIPQNATSNNRAQASLNPSAITSGTPTVLNNLVKYKVAVYDSNGTRVDEKEFSYTQNDSNGFMLNGGQTYTFVAYSVNSTSSIDTPTLTNGGTLATAKLANMNKDLMFFKKTIAVSGNGPNYLNIILKHQFSQITTILDARQVGTITSIVASTISPAKTSADLSFNNDLTPLSYNSDISGGTAVNFPTLNSQYVSSTPTQVISPTNANGILNINAVTIDGVAKPVVMNNINITPGVKYDLRLRFGPCRQDVTPTPFSVSNGNTKTFNMPATSFGFVFDIYFLDNSFKMTINGTKLATKEIQFQDNILGSPQNVAFADNSGTYEHNYPGIWTYDGNAINGNSTAVPIVRVVISPDGTVSMYGVKQNRGSLYPLKLVNGNSFNKVPWNTGSSNTVIASQQTFGSTTMNGIGIGKTIITCTNP